MEMCILFILEMFLFLSKENIFASWGKSLIIKNSSRRDELYFTSMASAELLIYLTN